MIRSWIASKLQRASAPVPTKGAASSSPFPKVTGGVDPLLLGTVVALIAFGVVMVFSASAVFASQRFHDGHFFLVRQAIFAVVAIAAMLVISRIDYHRLRPLTYPFLGTATLLLAYIALGGGHSANGAARWIPVGPVHVQPAELAKVGLILWLAYSLSKKQDRIRDFKLGMLPHLVMVGLLSVLCLKQPDFGGAVMMVAMTFVLLFAAGARTVHIVPTVIGLGGLAALLVMSSPMRMRRMLSYEDPFGNRQGAGYQLAESLLAFGSGGPTGVGLGDSRQKLFFLPEAHTDFISAIVGEELGFVGICALVLAFSFVVVRGVRAAFRAADDYGTYLAIGMTLFVALQAFTNLGVATGMLPTDGLVLPFVSYGGSSLLVNAAAVGVLLNVSRPREGAERVEKQVSDDAPARTSSPRVTAGAPKRIRQHAGGTA